jgi:hypothetical protein
LSPLERFRALTLCMEEAVRENRVIELGPLLEARAKVVQEMLASPDPIGIDQLTSLQTVEQRLMADLQRKRNATLERLSALTKGKRARKAYTKVA